MSRSIIALLAITATAFLAACGSDDEGSGDGGSGGSEKLNIGVLFPGDAPYLDGYRKGLEQEAAKQDATLTVVNANWKPDVQATQMSDVLAKKPDGIIVWAVDQKAIVPSLARAAREDIPIIASNSEVDSSGREYVTAYTGPNDFMEGQLAAELMHEALGGEGQVAVVMGVPGTAPQVRRLAGFETKLQELGGDIKIIAEQPADWDKAKALNVTRSILTKYGDQLDGIFGQDDTMATAAAQAVKSAGQSEKIKVVGLGGSKDGLDAVKQGLLFGTMIQSPVQDGTLAVQAVTSAARGESVPETTYLKIPKVTSDNVAEFTPEW